MLKDATNYGIHYHEGDPDTMKFSASGNADTNNADICINGAGDGTVTIRGKTIAHSGNFTSFALSKSQVTTALGYTPPTTNSTYNFSGVSFTSGNSNTASHVCDDIVSNFTGYYTSKGPASTATDGGGATTDDGSIYCQAYSNAWVTQFAQDYRTGCMWVRSHRGDTNAWTAWRRNLASGYNDPIKSTATSTTLSGNGASRFFYFVKASTTKASIDTGY